MKATFIALLAFSLCLPALGAKKKTDVEKHGYKGRVKSVKQSGFKIEEKFGKPVRSQVGLKYTSKYDEKGNLTERVRYDASGKISAKFTYKYDEKGNQTEEVYYYVTGNLTGKYTYKHDEKGNKTEEVSYDASGKVEGKYTYKYDRRGNKISRIEYESKTDFGGTRFVPIEETIWEFTYWD